MKKLILVLLLSPLFAQSQMSNGTYAQLAQYAAIYQIEPNANWNDTTMISICGLRGYCKYPDIHYKPKGWLCKDPGGEPVYGPCQAFLGVDTPSGFIATTRRDHLVGKPVEKDLLDNPQKLAAYLSKVK